MNENKQRNLGRGLGALLGDDVLLTGNENLMTLRLAEIEPNAAQPRRTFDEASIADLADSIRIHGVITPLIVRKLPSGSYQIIAGERRWRASRMAGLSHLPALVIDADDRKAAELMLIENLQREELGVLEVAEGYRTLMDEYGLTQDDVSRQIGRSRSAIANVLRLLSLRDPAKKLLTEGKLTEGHARALLGLSGKQQDSAAEHTAAQAYSVRQTESYVKKLLEDSKKKPKDEPVNYLEEYERGLSEYFKRKVRIVAGKERGRIEIDFYGESDFEKLIKQLGGE